jgi:hypothetical protein
MRGLYVLSTMLVVLILCAEPAGHVLRPSCMAIAERLAMHALPPSSTSSQ